MTLEFRQGVPEGCREWLNKNVGRGNITSIYDSAEYDWFYERVEQEIPSTDPSMDSNVRYVPTITVKDPKLAMLFVLRWSS
tara:strand:+ start:1460 stop:1702 length:243 start_codon:yes stop_codon:yes gene_type:complete